jgi:hypothetical protein
MVKARRGRPGGAPPDSGLLLQDDQLTGRVDPVIPSVFIWSKRQRNSGGFLPCNAKTKQVTKEAQRAFDIADPESNAAYVAVGGKSSRSVGAWHCGRGIHLT